MRIRNGVVPNLPPVSLWANGEGKGRGRKKA
jgi:hypothetical protein